MVKSSSRSDKKGSKFTINLGPHIDRLVKKKLKTRDTKIKKQEINILALEKENAHLKKSIHNANDLKVGRYKMIISDLQTTITDLKNQLETVKNVKPTQALLTESQKKAIKVGETQISMNNDTVQRARRSILNGKSMSRMKDKTKFLIERANLWEEFQMLERKVQNSKNPLRSQIRIKIV
jgi:hypothetical protein